MHSARLAATTIPRFMSLHIGVLTSGGDCPGLNAAIRGLGRTARTQYGMRVTGFLNGFRGIALGQTVELDDQMLSGILTDGGTILGTSRDKPHRMNIGGKVTDMTDAIVDNYHKLHLDILVCIGGGGTQKNAKRLMDAGLKVITLPKTIDKDIGMTDSTFGFDTALQIATEAIDRLHSTATSHERIIVLEVMGHRAGWLALEAGIAGGADVILLPEIPYDPKKVAESIRNRTMSGKRFSIVAVAEGAMALEDAKVVEALLKEKDAAETKKERAAVRETGEIPRGARGPHHPPHAPARGTHRPGNEAHNSWSPPARRHSVRARPRVRHLARRPLRAGDPRGRVRRDAGPAGFRAETRAAQGCRGKQEPGAAGPPVHPHRTGGRSFLRRLTRNQGSSSAR